VYKKKSKPKCFLSDLLQNSADSDKNWYIGNALNKIIICDKKWRVWILFCELYEHHI